MGNLRPSLGNSSTLGVAAGLAVLLTIVVAANSQAADSWWTERTAIAAISLMERGLGAPAPIGRWGSALAYNSQSDRAILVGGFTGFAWPNDTWAFDYETKTWTDRNPLLPPTEWAKVEMSYDSESDRTILVGLPLSGMAQTWTYDYAMNTWTNKTRPTLPPGSEAIAYDSESDRTILFSGSDTWAYDYDTNTWQRLSTIGQPPSDRTWPAMAYDSQSDRVIMFGGGEDAKNDTWAYDYNTNTWTDMIPTVAPPGRRLACAAYVAQSDRLILFGGMVAGEGPPGFRDDTWSYDYDTNTWTNMSPSVKPSRRHGCAMAYDATSDRIIMFGGLEAAGLDVVENGETWSYDFAANTWTLLQPAYVDTTRPTITIDSPSDGATVSPGPVHVQGSASDDVGIGKVQITLDGVSWYLANGTTSWSGIVTLTEGVNRIYARAEDTSGNAETANISVTAKTPVTFGPELVTISIAVAAVVAGVVGLLAIRRKREK